jgi:hypothetical protein
MIEPRGAVCHPVEKGSSEVSCPCCGRDNRCGVVASTDPITPCWCRAVKIPSALLASVLTVSGSAACICQSCVVEEFYATWPTLATVVADRLDRIRRDR